jgi:uncharacterized protein (TIGR02597 family)
MKSLKYLATIYAMALSSAMAATTAPVGFVSVTVPANSDVALGAPLGRASEFQGVIQTISGSTVAFSGTPNFASNGFVYAAGVQRKTYFLRIDTGTKEGLILPIIANGSGSVDVAVPAGEDLTGINTAASNGTGDQVSIAPYWTPGTLITGVLPGTQLLRYSSNTPGTNLAPTLAYAFNGTNWRYNGNNIDDEVIQPFEGITLRNNSTTLAQTISITGAVPMTGFRIRLYTLASATAQDQRIFYNSPIPEAIGSVFSGPGLVAGDRLLAFDNSASGKNKAPIEQVVWNGTQWRKDGTNVSASYFLQPGVSYIYRKNQTVSPTAVLVSDLQSYLQ